MHQNNLMDKVNEQFRKGHSLKDGRHLVKNQYSRASTFDPNASKLSKSSHHRKGGSSYNKMNRSINSRFNRSKQSSVGSNNIVAIAIEEAKNKA